MNGFRVCIVGGIFDVPEARRRGHAPEVVLAGGLARRNVEVTMSGHRGFRPSAAFDLVHVHHLGRAALAMATSPTRSPFLFTSHQAKLLNDFEVSRRRNLAMRFLATRAEALVTLSDAETRRMESLFPGVGRKCVTIANGFPAEEFYPSAEAREPGRPRLLFAGQLIAMKGVDVLLEAAARLAPARDFELWLVYHNAELEANHRALAASLGIADRVRFLGFRSTTGLAELYRSVDLLVLPSLAEALSSVLIEAMMCGLPVVASSLIGVAEQVGPHGHLARPGDAPDLASAIARALDDVDRGHFSRLEIAGRANARFSVDAMVDKHLALYRDLIEGGRVPERHRRRFRPVNLGARLALDAFGRQLSGRGLLSG